MCSWVVWLFLGEMYTHLVTPESHQQQTEVTIPLKPSLANQWVYWDSLQVWVTRRKLYPAPTVYHPSTGDSWWNLCPWISLHNLQTAWLFGESLLLSTYHCLYNHEDGCQEGVVLVNLVSFSFFLNFVLFASWTLEALFTSWISSSLPIGRVLELGGNSYTAVSNARLMCRYAQAISSKHLQMPWSVWGKRCIWPSDCKS